MKRKYNILNVLIQDFPTKKFFTYYFQFNDKYHLYFREQKIFITIPYNENIMWTNLKDLK